MFAQRLLFCCVIWIRLDPFATEMFKQFKHRRYVAEVKSLRVLKLKKPIIVITTRRQAPLFAVFELHAAAFEGKVIRSYDAVLFVEAVFKDSDLIG